MSYEDGTVVWVKLKGGARLWWVGQVTTQYPEDLLAGNRTAPLAVVKFFSDQNEFEVVKKSGEILNYGCPKKEEFIRKGKQNLTKNKQNYQKFIADCKEAETLTGGSADFIDSLDASTSTPKKPPEYAKLFKSTPPPPKSAYESAGLVKLTFKKPGSQSKKPPPRTNTGDPFGCEFCDFSCKSSGILLVHRKSHNAFPSPSTSLSARASESVAKPKSPVKATPPEKLLSPKKAVSPAKSPAGGPRGRKRKVLPESTVPGADKQEILADWSDGEGDSPENSHSGLDLEPKKPRTDQELHDAFESLLKTTKPTIHGEDSVPPAGAEIKSGVEEQIGNESHTVDNRSVDSLVTEHQRTEYKDEPELAIEVVEKSENPPELEVTEPLEIKVEETHEVVLEKVSDQITEVYLEETIDNSSTTHVESASQDTADPETFTDLLLTETSTVTSEEVKSEVFDTVEFVPHAQDNKSSPTAKVIGVSKLTSGSGSIEEVKTEKVEPTVERKIEIDDAEELQNEVDALLAATKPVEISHEQLFAARPDLQYKVTPVQLKSELSNPISPSSTSTPISPPLATVPISKTSPIPSPSSRTSLVLATKSVPPKLDTIMTSTTTMPGAVTSQRVIARPITTAQALKANSAGELLLQQGGTGLLRMTKPSSSVIQEKIVILPSDISVPSTVKSPPALQVQLQQQLSAFHNQQNVKLMGSGTVPPVATIITPTANLPAKKGRSKKQTFPEQRQIISQTGILNQPASVGHPQITALTTAQLFGSPAKIHTPAPVQTVQSLQTKVHALPTAGGVAATAGGVVVSGGTRAMSPGAGMVRLSTGMAAGSAPPKQYQQRTSSPAILTKPTPNIRYQRQALPQQQQTPAFVSSASDTSHYQIVTSSAVATKQEGNEQLFVISEGSTPTHPQQQYVLASGAVVGGSAVVTPQAVAITSSIRKKAPANKKAVPGPPIFKVPEVRSKPTATIRPTLSEEESMSGMDAKIQEVLMTGQKTEKILTAEKVVHLLPIQNPDGTVTYMLVHLDETGTGVRIDQAEAGPIGGEMDPIFVESDVTADKLLATVIHQSNQPPPTKKQMPRKPPGLGRGTPVAPRAKNPTPRSSLTQGTRPQTQPNQPAQPRQFVIGQQQQLQQQFIQIQSPPPRQPTASQQYHQLIQSTEPPGTSTSMTSKTYHAQKQSTISQQHVHRQVFVTQPQQSHGIQQQHPVTTTAENPVVTAAANAATPVPQLQSLHIQQPIQPTAIPSPSPVVPAVAEKSQIQMNQIQEPQTYQQQQGVQAQAPAPQAEEPQMPALIETKVDTIQGQQQQFEQQQVHYVIQSQGGELGELQGMNMEIPIEMQDYMQIVAAEDGTQYYVTADGYVPVDMAQQAYVQVAAEDGGTVSYENTGMETEQFLFMQEDGSVVTPQQLGMDAAALLAFQQQYQLQQQQEQEQLQATETIVQAQPEQQNQPNV